MKNNKLVLCLSSLAIISLITTGCGKEVELKNGSKVAVSIKDNKFTATEYYNKIKENNITELINMIDKSIFEKKYKTDDKEKESINNQIESIKKYYGEDENTFKAVIQQYFGVNTEEELKEMLSLDYKRNKAVEDYIKKNITEDEVKKYYNEKITGQIKASHILIPVETTEDSTDEEKTEAENLAKEKAEKIIKKLKKGEKFTTLAKKNSSDKSSSENGGDLGYFNPEDMVEEFSNAVKELKNNEFTKEPVKTEFGYHIILRTGEKDKPKLKDVKNEIKEKIMNEKIEKDQSLKYVALKEIREENKIKWNDDILKKAYNNYMNELIKQATANQQ